MKLLALACLLSFQLHAQTLTGRQVEIITEAIYRAEGTTNAEYLYGVKSVPYRDKADAKRICQNSIRDDYSKWIKSGRTNGFFLFMSRIYCPLDSKHWCRNVSYFYNHLK